MGYDPFAEVSALQAQIDRQHAEWKRQYAAMAATIQRARQTMTPHSDIGGGREASLQ